MLNVRAFNEQMGDFVFVFSQRYNRCLGEWEMIILSDEKLHKPQYLILFKTLVRMRDKYQFLIVYCIATWYVTLWVNFTGLWRVKLGDLILQHKNYWVNGKSIV